MAQQIQGGGVTFDAGAGVREAGRNINDAGMQLMQNLTARKNTMVQAAEQARVAFFNNAQLTGMTPQQYASTVGAEEYKRMVEAQGQAMNAEKIFGNFMKSGKVDSEGQLNNFNDFQNLTEESRMRMDSNNIDVQNHFAVDAQGRPIPAQGQPAGNNAPQISQGTAQGQAGGVIQQGAPVQEQKYPYMPGGRDVPPPMVNADVKYPYMPGGRENPPPMFGDGLFNNTPTGQANLARMQSAGAPLAQSGAPMSAYQPPVAPPPKPLTTEQQLAGAPPSVKAEAKKIDSANAVANAAAEKIALEAKKAQLETKGISEKKTPAISAIVTSKGIDRVEKADAKALAKEIIEVQDAEGLKQELIASSQKVFPTGDVTQPAIPLGATPFAEKSIAHNVEKTNASTDVVIKKAEDLTDKLSSGYKLTDKDIASFKAILDANKGNYAKTLSQLDPRISIAISQRAVAEVMGMNSVRAQIAGLTDVASRKAAQEQLANSLAIVTKQMEQKATGLQGLDKVLEMINKSENAYNDAMKTASENGKISTAEVYKKAPHLKDMYNGLESLKQQMYPVIGLAYTATQVDVQQSPGLFGTGLFGHPEIVTTSGANSQAAQTAARQSAIATPQSSADLVNAKTKFGLR